MSHRRALVLTGLSLVVATVLDLRVAPWPYVTTPLYAIPILIAAQFLTTREAIVVAALSIAANVASSLIQGLPVVAGTLDTVGLLLTAYLGILLAHQRQDARRQAREIEEARLRLRRFMGLVVHDLRNPLTGMLGYTQLLRRRGEGLSPESRERTLEGLETDEHRMKRLLDDLRDATVIMEGRFQVRTAPMDLAAVAREVVDLRRAATEKHRLTLNAPDRLEGDWDRERIAQVLANLISNAIKYSPEGSEVVVAVRETDGKALVSVSDQGSGIPAEQMGLLFQPFSRLGNAQTIEGTGLGLYITAGIVKALGGRIWVESVLGKGSTFNVALPIWTSPRSQRQVSTAGW